MCGLEANDVSIAAIRGMLTPEVRGTTETPTDIANNLAIVRNIQLREAWVIYRPDLPLGSAKRPEAPSNHPDGPRSLREKLVAI